MKLGIVLTMSIALIGCASGHFASIAASKAAVTGDPWFDGAELTLAQRKTLKPIKGKAKNVILFVADGMDPTTVAATRIYDGQSRGEEGEEGLLSFERFPYLAMSKTYNTDSQVPDSAGTMSSMATGFKTRAGVISVKKEVQRGDCSASLQGQAKTFIELAEMAGKATGVLSTARLTHATPAATYAHVPDRRWERDTDLPEGAYAVGCNDIASQLIDFSYGDGIDFAIGGGRANFLPMDVQDPEYAGRTGSREDGRNLVAEWISKSDRRKFVWNKAQFDAINPEDNPQVLGLFEISHMEYESDRDTGTKGEPSLEDMTRKAIDILSRNDEGFVLMVEAGRVDHAHHAGNAARALEEAQEFSQAVAAARDMTSENDTLIIATADHGHTLTFAGYPGKGSPILGLAMQKGKDDVASPILAADGKPYTTLGYANGPGSVFQEGRDLSNGRPRLSAEEVKDIDFLQVSQVPTRLETHGGQDVTIYASGPNAYLFTGVVEQNYIFHVIMDALKVSEM